MTRRKIVMVGLAGFAVVSAVLTGCGGDDNNGGPGTPTSTPTGTSTPVGTTNFSSQIDLGNGQTGVLSLRGQNGRATGTLSVNAAAVFRSAASRLSVAIPSGTYAVSGNFAPPRSFSVTGSFGGSVGAFALAGTSPTGSQAGSFRLRVGSQTTSGTIPISTGTPEPTTTGTASATSTGSPSATSTGQPNATSTGTPNATSTSQPNPTSTGSPNPTSTTRPNPTSTTRPNPTSTTRPNPTSTTRPNPTSTSRPNPTTPGFPGVTPVPTPAPLF